jgi:uroporphyrinogen-III decarboxylase
VLTYTTDSDDQTTWITEYLLKSSEDIELIQYLPVPSINKEHVQKQYDEMGDEGVLRGFVFGDQAGCWQHAACYMDISELILLSYDEPEAVHYFLKILLDKKLQFIHESLKGARFDIIETGGGSASSTVISPALFKDFCLPYDRAIHDALHYVGLKSTYHTCGGMFGILDLILQTHTDMSETLSNKNLGGNTDGPEIYEALHGKVCLNGGLDQINILTNGAPQDVRKEVHRIFEIYGKGGGYTMSCCDHFFEAPVENIQAYAAAARECIY